MIHGRLMPNSHPVAPNAKLKLRREPPFITGHHHAKCFVQVVVMHRIVSFSQALLMRMSIMERVILMPGKLKEGEIPFLVVGRRKIRSIFFRVLNNNFTFFNGSSFIVAGFLTSVLVRESSFLHLGAFHYLFTEYRLVRSGCFSDAVTMMPNSTAVIRSSRLHIFFNEHPVYLPSPDFPMVFLTEFA